MKSLTLLFIIAFLVIHALKAQNTAPFITNGAGINITQAPYQVSIQGDQGGHFCGGSIINSQYVLTAAHCVDNINQDTITVNAGLTLQNVPGNHQQRRNVSSFTIHPNYNAATLDYDIAVMEIDRPFNFNNHVQQVTLISNSTLDAERTGNQVRVNGWGWTTTGVYSTSNDLQATTVPAVYPKIGIVYLSSKNDETIRTDMLSTLPRR